MTSVEVGSALAMRERAKDQVRQARGRSARMPNASGLAADEIVGKRVRKSFGSRFFWGSVVGCYHVADALFYKISFDDGDVDIVAAVEVQEDIKQEDRSQQSVQQQGEEAADGDERAPRSYRDEMHRSTPLKRRREETNGTVTAIVPAPAVATVDAARAEQESDSVDVTLWGHRLFTSIVTNRKTTSIADFVKQDDGVSIGELEATGKVKRGDIITHIDGRPVSGMNSVMITHMIRASKRPMVMTFQQKHGRRKAPHDDAVKPQQSMQHSAVRETQEGGSNGSTSPATARAPVEQDGVELEAPPATQPARDDGQPEYNTAKHNQVQQPAPQDPRASDALRVNLKFSRYAPASKRQYTATTGSVLPTTQSSSFTNTSSTVGTTAFARSTTQADPVSLPNRYYATNALASFVTPPPPPFIPPPLYQLPLDPRFMVVNQVSAPLPQAAQAIYDTLRQVPTLGWTPQTTGYQPMDNSSQTHPGAVSYALATRPGFLPQPPRIPSSYDYADHSVPTMSAASQPSMPSNVPALDPNYHGHSGEHAARGSPDVMGSVPRVEVIEDAQRPASAPLIPDEPDAQHSASPSFDDNASYHDDSDVVSKSAVETGTSMLSASSEHAAALEQMSFLSPSKGSFVSSLPSTGDNLTFAQPSTSSYWTSEFDGCAVVQIRRNRLFVTLGTLGSHVCITSFVHGPSGERGEIEMSGKVFLGDIIVAISGTVVAPGTSPTQVARVVIALDRPFEIAFQRASWDTLEGK